MPHEWDEETIREYWGYCGEIESLDMLVFPDTGNFNGVMFITFKTEVGESAERVHRQSLTIASPVAPKQSKKREGQERKV